MKNLVAFLDEIRFLRWSCVRGCPRCSGRVVVGVMVDVEVGTEVGNCSHPFSLTYSGVTRVTYIVLAQAIDNSSVAIMAFPSSLIGPLVPLSYVLIAGAGTSVDVGAEPAFVEDGLV